MKIHHTNNEKLAYLNRDHVATLVIERARQLVKQLVEQRGHENPPFLGEEFARLLGVKRIEKADLQETSGILLRLAEGYIIKTNERQHSTRGNFSCAHEIGHILLDELKLEPRIEDEEFRTFNPQAHAIARARARERICDIAATELLMPEQVFKRYLSYFGVSVYSLERLANVFKVSIQSTAIRMAELSTEPSCVALLWKPWPRNNPKALRLAWPKRNPQGKLCIPVNTVVRPPSTLHKAYQQDSPVKSLILFKVGNTKKRLRMESKGFGRDENRYVISLALHDR